MSSAETIDFELLTKPFEGENPAGVNLMTEDDGALYYLTKGPRDASANIERRHFAEPEKPEYFLSRCQWDEARRQAVAVLSEQSKDLDVATWLCEALTREEGFAGVRDGFRLIREFAESDLLWPNCYPAAEANESGELNFESRIKMLRSLLEGGTLAAAIANIPLTQGERYTLLEYQQAERMKDVVDEDERSAALGGLRDVKLSQFDSDAANSDDAFCLELGETVRGARAELELMIAALDQKCGTDDIGQPVAPSPRKLDECFGQVLDCLSEVYKQRVEPPSEAALTTGELITDGEAPPDGTVAATNPAAAAASGGLTREMAFDLLGQLARFFEDKEPANPASFQIRKAIRCGPMTLPEILKEAIPDDDERRAAFLNLGIDFEQNEDE